MGNALGFREVLARERGKFFLKDDERTKELRVVVADRTLSEIAEEDLPVIHHPAEVETGSRLPEDRPHHRIGDEGPRLIEHGAHGFFPEGTRPPGERVRKEIEDGGVLDVPQATAHASPLSKQSPD